MSENYLPDDVVERILIWKEIKEAQIIARGSLAIALEIKREYESSISTLSERSIEHHQTYSVKSMYAYNDAINAFDAVKKQLRQALKTSREAVVMLQTARALI